MSDTIEIKIDAPKLTPDKFQKAVNEFFALLKGVTKNVTGDSKPEDWIIAVRASSQVVSARTESQSKALVTDAMSRGFLSLMAGVQTIPPHFTKEDVISARNLAALVDDDGKIVRNIFIQNGGAPIRLSNDIIKTADAILAGEKQIAFGSVEGVLESLHRKENQPLTSTIKDPIHGRSIVSTFTTPECEEKAFEAFKDVSRVLFSGLIHYNKEGEAVRIDVSFVRIFPPESELPTLEEIHKFWK
jgi:hypothetical protein